MPTESPYRRTLRLRREIHNREREIMRIQEQSNRDQVIIGLKRTAQMGGTLDVQCVNVCCVGGELHAPEVNGFGYGKHFGLEGFHSSISANLFKSNVIVTADDGTLNIQFGFPQRKPHQPQTPEILKSNLRLVRNILRRYNVEMDVQSIEGEIAELQNKINHKQALIDVIREE